MANFKDTPSEPVVEGAMEANNPDAANNPEVKQTIEQAKQYEVVLINLIHGKQTRDKVINMLKSNPDPFIAIPETVMTINDMGVGMMKKGGIKVPEGVQLVASQFLISDIVELGNASKSWENPVGEDQVPALIEDSYQKYIERGLNDKTIDPIQLQLEAQKAMTPEQATAGAMFGQREGIPMQPQQGAMLSQQVNSRLHQERQSALAGQAKQQAMEKQKQMQALAAQNIAGGK
jgi:hypothetical protein